jgi:outer membrane protein insertion porin family
MQVESTQVSITPDKKDIYITVNVNEGEKFTVADIKLEGEMLGREKEFESLIKLKTGEPYSGEKMTESTRKISERMGVFGYAFANVNASPQINREKNEVSFTIFVDPGKRVYVRRINIGGNDRTRDEVIRREFRQFESSWYDGDKIRLSRDRLGRLGFFTDTAVDTVDIPGTQDQVDLNVNVVEKPTGSVMVGAGFSSSEKVTLTGSINQANAFGSGNNIGITVNTSRIFRTIALSHTNPYFTADGVSRTVEVFLRTTRPPLYLTNVDFRVESRGANMSFGIPVSELDRIFVGAGIENTQVQTYDNSPLRYKTFVADNLNQNLDPSDDGYGVGAAKTTAFPLTMAWQRDNRDSALIPTKGRYRRVNLELSPAGSAQYYRSTYQDQYFMPIFGPVTLALNGEISYGAGLSSKTYPIFKNYYAGGIGSVRGFFAGSLSVDGTGLGTSSRYNLPIGGQARVIMNAELQLPFPGTGVDRSLRWFTFFDAGQVFNPQDGQNISLGDLRYSTGVGISWISPVGPLKLSLGYPINPQSFDRIQRFQFQLGTGF